MPTLYHARFSACREAGLGSLIRVKVKNNLLNSYSFLLKYTMREDRQLNEGGEGLWVGTSFEQIKLRERRLLCKTRSFWDQGYLC